MAGNFQDGSIPGKIQFGSGWWFLDQKEGIEWQLNALSNVGLLSRFVWHVDGFPLLHVIFPATIFSAVFFAISWAVISKAANYLTAKISSAL